MHDSVRDVFNRSKINGKHRGKTYQEFQEEYRLMKKELDAIKAERQKEAKMLSQIMRDRREDLKRWYFNMSVLKLKEHAEAIGLKKYRVGWPTCCPPDGDKEDLVNAIANFEARDRQN